MKVLYIVEKFAPISRVASIRNTKIAKYLSLIGNYEIDVFTNKKKRDIEDDELRKDLQYIHNIETIDSTNIFQKMFYYFQNRGKSHHSSLSQKQSNNKNSFFKKRLSDFKHFVSEMLILLSSYCVFKKFKKYFKKRIFQYDIVYTSYAPYFTHFFGRYCKNKNKRIIWIADFRDPVLVYSTPLLLKKYTKNFADKVCRKADIITTVSEGTLSLLYLTKKTKAKKLIISNGFDEIDYKNFEENKTKREKFTVFYCGTLNEGMDDFSIVSNALNDLIRDGLIDYKRVLIKYYGDDGSVFRKQMSLSYDVEFYFESHVQRSEILKEERSSHLLLLASYNNENSEGFITGKFYEYIKANVPILCVITGNKANSDLCRLVNRCNVGYSFEYVNGNYDDLKKFIYGQYRDYISNINSFFPNEEEIMMFSHANLVKKLVNVIEDMHIHD